MIFYDETISLSDTTSITNLGASFIIATFNKKYTRHCAYNCNLQTTQNANILFHFYFGNYIKKIPINCPIIIVGGFNIDMLTKPSQSIILQKFMNDISLLDIPQTCILHI
jgi:hypothetical protein